VKPLQTNFKIDFANAPFCVLKFVGKFVPDK
jgi:hypothetical protein